MLVPTVGYAGVSLPALNVIFSARTEPEVGQRGVDETKSRLGVECCGSLSTTTAAA